MNKSHPLVHQIELRIGKLSELFNSMDPTPFHHRNLDKDAEEFLESWALDFSQKSHFKIIVHIEEVAGENSTAVVTEAIHNYFQYKSEYVKRTLGQLLHEGRVCLFIGLAFLAICLLSAEMLVANFSGNTLLSCLRKVFLLVAGLQCGGPCIFFSTVGGRLLEHKKFITILARLSYKWCLPSNV